MLDYAIASVPWPSIIICIITPLLEGTLKLVLLSFISLPSLFSSGVLGQA